MKTITLGYPLVQLQSVDSTNNYASQLLQREPVSEGTVILAVYQTSGRGQGENKWISDEGLNLLFSIVLKPDFLPAHMQFYLSMAIAVGIQSFISKLGLASMIKWPNDIQIHGKKVAGILIENTIMSKNLNTSVIGIGLNVNQVHFPEDLPASTSLSRETGNTFHLPGTLNDVLACLETSLNTLYLGNFAEIKSLYLNRLWLLNQVTAFTDNTGTFNGKIVDIAETGELVVIKTSGETVTYGFREVKIKGKTGDI